MVWCDSSRKGPQCRASSGGGAAGWSVSTSTLYIPWRRRSSKALRPFSRGVYGWVFCAKNWQLHSYFPPQRPVCLGKDAEGAVRGTLPWFLHQDGTFGGQGRRPRYSTLQKICAWM